MTKVRNEQKEMQQVRNISNTGARSQLCDREQEKAALTYPKARTSQTIRLSRNNPSPNPTQKTDIC